MVIKKVPILPDKKYKSVRITMGKPTGTAKGS